MDTVSGKADIRAIVKNAGAQTDLVSYVHKQLLGKKAKFPLLEFAAKELYKQIPEAEQTGFTDGIMQLNTIGGNVLAGIFLQLRLQAHMDESVGKAAAYIIYGNEWYVCDIIGERVYGYALLTMPDKMLPVLHELARHPDKWIVRSTGVAVHYAIKKGLKRQYIEPVFKLLLSLGNTTDFHTKKGIGWAAKTLSKFHPDVIERYRQHIDSSDVKQWFRTKIKIGLGRTEKYAGRFTG